MSLQLLFIEDSPHKRTRISDHLRSLGLRLEITEAASFTSGCRSLDLAAYQLVLMDMSLPTYDRVGAESGGKFRTFGGREIARKIVRRNLPLKIIFITQYQSFSDRGHSQSYESLKSELESECGDKFGGMIFYDSSKSAWKDELEITVLKIINENTNS